LTVVSLSNERHDVKLDQLTHIYAYVKNLFIEANNYLHTRSSLREQAMIHC
jgi:hypothetical protein